MRRVCSHFQWQEEEKLREYEKKLKFAEARRKEAERKLEEQLQSVGQGIAKNPQSRKVLSNFEKEVNKQVKKKKAAVASKARVDDDDTSTDEDLDPIILGDEDEESVVDVAAEVMLINDDEELLEGVIAEAIQDDIIAEAIQEEEEEEEEIKITNHFFNKKICYINCVLPGETGTSQTEIWWLWYEFPKQLRSYIKKNKLKGLTWTEPKEENCTKMVAIIEHCGGKKKCELHVLWNTGFSEWADEEVIMEDKQAFLKSDMVEEYWNQKPSSAKKTTPVTVEKTATTKKTKRNATAKKRGKKQ